MSVIAPEAWPTLKYMPRTRDLSSTRRTLLQAWARKFLGGQATADGAPSNPARQGKLILR
jgi:hypothetical protein